MTNNTDHAITRTTRSFACLAVLATVATLGACGSSDSVSEPSPAIVTTTVGPGVTVAAIPTTVGPTGPFHSDLYGYNLTSPDWTGRSATYAWDGTGSPGNLDPTVDVLRGPNREQAYAFGGPTTMTLDAFVAAARTANNKARGCPVKPSATARITVGGQPAIVDELDCGVFALSATVVSGGQVYAFFTFDQPGKEDEMRTWFHSMLEAVAFE